MQGWFPPVATVSMEARITNFFIVTDFLVTLLTQQGAPLEVIGYGWYAFFSGLNAVIRIIPLWWQYMFLRRPGYTTPGQEEICAFLHGGSFFYTALMIYFFYICLLPMIPLMGFFKEFLVVTKQRFTGRPHDE